MTIDSIQNGYVLDHIPAGLGVRIYKLLGLDKSQAQVALIQNAKSSKMGKKDVLKISTDRFDLNLDVVAYLAPHTTVNVIRNGAAAQKQVLHLPNKLVNIVHCPNPACISNHEQVEDVFTLVDADKGTYRCLYCETAAKFLY